MNKEGGWPCYVEGEGAKGQALFCAPGLHFSVSKEI